MKKQNSRLVVKTVFVTLPNSKVHPNNIPSRQIDKAGDLVEESNNIPEVRGKNLKENANSLKIQVKCFGERLEEIRENLEEASRCFQLLESSREVIDNDNEKVEYLKKVALKTGNEKLGEVWK
ncbi:hypothetical protein ILUMI_08994, partial [Ignelater luminosus]